MAPATAFLVTTVYLAMVAGVADASAFRGSSPVAAMGRMSVEELRATMLDELMAALGSGNRVTEQRLSAIEQVLHPMFLSMPKNAQGNLEHASVRYVLHRLFVQRHGMYVKGLEPSGEAWNVSSPTDVLDDKVPEYVQNLFEERLNGRGMGMHEIAILAATLEHLIHNEAVERLKASYEAHGWSLEQRLKNDQVAEAIDTYMVLFLQGKNVSALTPEVVMEERANIKAIYPGWPETQKFARTVTKEVAGNNKGDLAFRDNQLDFSAASQVVEEIGERYGRWQDSECQDLKKALSKLEEADTGRVPLNDFYGKSLGGAWQFSESVQYLRELGALDETDPKQKSVIISNYINAPSNCLASSGLYSVCCLNECEGLLGHIEKTVGQPDVDPARLIDIVVGLPSSTVDAPRDVSTTLRTLLGEVAGHHGGRVPIHGRLFAQWLHHAYPRECPYPHVSGTTTPQTAEEWMNDKSVSAVAGAEEMQRHVDEFEKHARAADHASTSSVENKAKPLMWTAEEELVVMTTAQPTGFSRWLSVTCRNAAFLAVLASAGVSLKNFFGSVAHAQTMLPLAKKQHFC